MTTLQLRVERGVAFLLFDSPRSTLNVLSASAFDEIEDALDTIETDTAVTCGVLGSAKDGGFLAGADLHQFLAMTEPAEGEAFAKAGQRFLLRIERSRTPWVAAVHGAALGSGLDLSLACHYRIATDHPKTVFGFPEVTLGVIPGGGGTHRLARVVGLRRALALLVTGKRLPARRAYHAGLVDMLTSPGGVLDTAAAAARRLASGALTPRRHLAVLDRLLVLPGLRSAVFSRARRDVLKRTHGFYPAPISALDAMEHGLAHGLASGLERDAKLFGRLVVGSDSKNLIHLFESTAELRRAHEAGAPQRVCRIGVLGAGLMGEGIAAASLATCAVVLKDVSEKALSRAARSLHEGLTRRRRSGAITDAERDRHWFGLTLASDAAALAGADLVIEAVFEDLELKRRVLAEMESVISEDAVYASNTSALPIAEIARDAVHPERVLGMHYFSPVPRMPLVEIVVGPKTSDRALATARSLASAQGKTVIVVRDSPGFYTTRILSPYLSEAVRLLEEGADVRALDRALADFGFLVGPAALLDEVGIDVGAHVTDGMAALFEPRGMPRSDALSRAVAAGHAGKKSGLGFYRYDGRRRRDVAPGIYAFVGGGNRKEIPLREMAERCVLLMVNEAVHCLGDGVLMDARDGDVGAILGLGFPPFRGGPFRYVDALGASAVVDRLSQLVEKLGPRFTPAPLLVERARDDRRFTPA